MSHQSFRQAFVTNSSALLASGSTVEQLAVGQIGILDAKTHAGVTAPTYAKNKALEIVWGTPDVGEQALLSGVPNENIYSKLIKGKLIKDFVGRKAKRGQNQILTVGFSGDVTDTDTLSAMPGEIKKLFVTLSGGPIDKLFSRQGITREYVFEEKVASDCTDTCVAVDPRKIADSLVKQINSDASVNRFIKASSIVTCDPALDAPTTATVYKFTLTVCDTQDDVALGLVQAQYPGLGVKRIGTQGSSSIYEVVKTANVAPDAFSNEGITLIPNCATCPDGYVLVDNGFAYKVTKMDAGDAAALAAVASQYAITGTESVSRIAYEYGQSTYVVVADAALSAIASVNEVQSIIATGGTAGNFTLTFDGATTANIAYDANAAAVQAALELLPNIQPGDVTVTGGALPETAVVVTFGGQWAGTNVPALIVTDNITDGTAVVSTTTAGVAGGGELVFLGNVRNTCVLETPTEVDWAANGTLTKYAKTFRITLGDTVCGDDRLTELQDAFPSLTVALVDADGDCVHTYETTVYSDAVEVGCSVDLLKWTKPQAFDGVEWVAAATAALADGQTCLVGIKIETTFTPRVVTNETFGYFPYENEAIHVTASTFEPDYNGAPEQVENSWVVKQLRSVQFPVGNGAAVRAFEKETLGLALRERSFDPVVRQNERFSFQSSEDKFYDEYILTFAFEYQVGGWSQKESDQYKLHVFFPEGNGAAFEAAINSYLASANINIDPVVL